MVWTEDYEALYPNSVSIKPLQGKKYNYIIHELAMRLNRGEAPIVIFNGHTGSGKSEKALRLVEILQEELNLFKGEWTQDQLVYDPLEFLEKIMEIDEPNPENVDKDIHEERTAFIFDEAGINLNIADYHSDMNKSVDKVLQTMRILNSLYIFCVPELSSLDSRISRKADIIVEVEAQGVALPKLVEKDHTATKKAEAYNKIALYNHKWYPDRPSDENIKIYQNKELPFKFEELEKMYEDMKKEREEMKKKKQKEKASSSMEELI